MYVTGTPLVCGNVFIKLSISCSILVTESVGGEMSLGYPSTSPSMGDLATLQGWPLGSSAWQLNKSLCVATLHMSALHPTSLMMVNVLGVALRVDLDKRLSQQYVPGTKQPALVMPFFVAASSSATLPFVFSTLPICLVFSGISLLMHVRTFPSLFGCIGSFGTA